MKLVERFKVSSDEVIHISVFSDKTIVRREHMKSETYTGISEALQAVKTRYVQPMYLHDKKMVTAMKATRMDIGVAISCRTKRRYQEDEGWKI